MTSSVPAEITVGTETQRGFINDNVFHSAEYGEIHKILVLDVKDQAYFTERGYTDQHGGGMAFAHDETIMNWLFKNDST